MEKENIFKVTLVRHHGELCTENENRLSIKLA